jgi:hypothetical protein
MRLNPTFGMAPPTVPRTPRKLMTQMTNYN